MGQYIFFDLCESPTIYTEWTWSMEILHSGPFISSALINSVNTMRSLIQFNFDAVFWEDYPHILLIAFIGNEVSHHFYEWFIQQVYPLPGCLYLRLH